MAEIFTYVDYRRFIADRLAAMPKGGYGQLRRIATTLKMNPSLLSQILKGPTKELTLEHAAGIARYLKLSAEEAEYFLDLVQLSRAGSEALRTMIKGRLERQREKSRQVAQRLRKNQELSASAQAVFYSEWFYTALQLAVAIPGMTSVESLAAYFDVPEDRVRKAIQFLLAEGLIAGDEKNLRRIVGLTHVGSDSSFVGAHHRNWRIKALEKCSLLDKRELMFTAPMTLSNEGLALIRDALLECVAKVGTIVETNRDETLACLNIDLFKI